MFSCWAPKKKAVHVLIFQSISQGFTGDKSRVILQLRWSYTGVPTHQVLGLSGRSDSRYGTRAPVGPPACCLLPPPRSLFSCTPQRGGGGCRKWAATNHKDRPSNPLEGRLHPDPHSTCSAPHPTPHPSHTHPQPAGPCRPRGTAADLTRARS